jgi:MYXO-CTERM domain-containing protein
MEMISLSLKFGEANRSFERNDLGFTTNISRAWWRLSMLLHPTTRSLRRPLAIYATLLATALFSVTAHAQVFAPAADTFIETDNNGRDTANGAPGAAARERLFLYDNTGSFQAYPLLRFDLSSLTGTVVTAPAVLSLHVFGNFNTTAARTLDLRALTASFDPATATWNNFLANTNGALLTSAMVSPTEGQRISIPIPAAVVQSWIDSPGANFGFAIKPVTTNGPSQDIYAGSMESGVATQPTLTVVPEPSVMALAGLGALALMRRRRRD